MIELLVKLSVNYCWIKDWLGGYESSYSLAYMKKMQWWGGRGGGGGGWKRRRCEDINVFFNIIYNEL